VPTFMVRLGEADQGKDNQSHCDASGYNVLHHGCHSPVNCELVRPKSALDPTTTFSRHTVLACLSHHPPRDLMRLVPAFGRWA
jgi:hypothetical protein